MIGLTLHLLVETLDLELLCRAHKFQNQHVRKILEHLGLLDRRSLKHTTK